TPLSIATRFRPRRSIYSRVTGNSQPTRINPHEAHAGPACCVVPAGHGTGRTGGQSAPQCELPGRLAHTDSGDQESSLVLFFGVLTSPRFQPGWLGLLRQLAMAQRGRSVRSTATGAARAEG